MGGRGKSENRAGSALAGAGELLAMSVQDDGTYGKNGTNGMGYRFDRISARAGPALRATAARYEMKKTLEL